MTSGLMVTVVNWPGVVVLGSRPLRASSEGTTVTFVSPRLSRSHSDAPKRNVRSLTSAPPAENPNWFLLKEGFSASKKLRASNLSLRRNSKALPWKSLVPD